MKYLIEIIFILLMTSCTVNKFQTVAGRYRTKGGFEWGSSINLKPDSSFIYDWQIGGLFGHETGDWYIKENNLILNSDFRPTVDTTPDFYLLDKQTNNASNIRIYLNYSNSTDAVIGAIGLMFSNTDTIFKSISDIEGLITFPKRKYDSIKISFIGLKNIEIPYSNYDYFKIAAVDFPVDYLYEYFNNELWKIRGNNLIDKSKNKYYYEKRFYKIE